MTCTSLLLPGSTMPLLGRTQYFLGLVVFTCAAAQRGTQRGCWRSGGGEGRERRSALGGEPHLECHPLARRVLQRQRARHILAELKPAGACTAGREVSGGAAAAGRRRGVGGRRAAAGRPSADRDPGASVQRRGRAGQGLGAAQGRGAAPNPCWRAPGGPGAPWGRPSGPYRNLSSVGPTTRKFSAAIADRWRGQGGAGAPAAIAGKAAAAQSSGRREGARSTLVTAGPHAKMKRQPRAARHSLLQQHGTHRSGQALSLAPPRWSACRRQLAAGALPCALRPAEALETHNYSLIPAAPPPDTAQAPPAGVAATPAAASPRRRWPRQPSCGRSAMP